MNLHRRLIDSAARRPDAPAVVDEAGTRTYRELDDLAGAIARRLAALGVRRGDRVVLWADKSAAVVAAMQGVLRLGAAYVPVDGASPAGRVAALARDCGARAVCVGDGRLGALRAELGADAEYLDLDLPLTADGPSPDEPCDPGDLAFILYTSGSTGTPKGVCISHRAALAFVDWAVGLLDATAADRFANHAPFTFDLSVLDLYAPLTVGASVHLIPSALGYAPGQLVDLLYEREITVWYSVPSVLILMMRDGGLLERPPSAALRAVLFAGEPFPINYVRRLADWTTAPLFNLYGPTETNVCTFHRVEPADLDRDRPVPIGRPSCGDDVWAVRQDGAPAAEGEEGELMVDGPTVMLGYWGGEPQRGPYATGDVVRVLPGGAFDYVGRRDHMVKVRGHRIELGEVEAALAAHPDVDQVSVVVAGTAVNARLVAFIVPRPGRAPGVLDLKEHSSRRLPRYMIADRFHLVPELPRTRNGKVDRTLLVERHVERTVSVT
ncbi:amino acid adenylation domain-containing protein [Actinomadura chibensis]|uniref:D-alanine--poly(Phosphoribitol) ligase n=1 Tax=Actinomadura chibensis TaxID=392828 RepID=A0A5D0NLM5_9ACTN|nr:amino acid adenylation domain-containing protein [Actinomadura chibensis]TYB45410.1 D-alanine--poly(phosphoribitol) ligase [Actinomadura chibensis]